MKGRIYQLLSNTERFYYGSTIYPLEERLRKHKNSKRKTKLYNYIHTIGWDNIKIILIQEVEVETKQELKQIENTYIKDNDDLVSKMATMESYVGMLKENAMAKSVNINSIEMILNNNNLNPENLLGKMMTFDAADGKQANAYFIPAKKKTKKWLMLLRSTKIHLMI